MASAARLEFVHYLRCAPQQGMPVVQDLGENPKPRPDEVGGVGVDAGEAAFSQTLQDPVDGAATQADSLGQLPYAPALVAVPGDEVVEDGDDPVVPGDRPCGLLAHPVVVLSTRSTVHPLLQRRRA